MGRPKLTDEQKAANKAVREKLKSLKPDSTEDILAKLAHVQSQAPSNVLPVEEDGIHPEVKDAIEKSIKNNAPTFKASPEPTDPDYEAKMIEKIEQAMAAARQQTLDALKPPQIKITPLSASTSEVQIIGNREMEIGDGETQDPRPEFVQKDDA